MIGGTKHQLPKEFGENKFISNKPGVFTSEFFPKYSFWKY
jgi:hypothetical protein